MAPDGLLHRFGITQDEHPVEIAQTLQHSLGGPGMESLRTAARDTPRGVVSKYEVSVHFVRCWELLVGNRGCCVPVTGGEHLISAARKLSAWTTSVKRCFRRSRHLTSAMLMLSA